MASPADNAWYAVIYGNGIFVAVSTTGSGNRVMTSPDGIDWTLMASPADNIWSGITYGNGLFVAVAVSGTGDRVMTSGKKLENETNSDNIFNGRMRVNSLGITTGVVSIVGADTSSNLGAITIGDGLSLSGDTLTATGGSGTVTSVGTGFGLAGGPVTTTGTISADSAVIATLYALADTAAAIRGDFPPGGVTNLTFSGSASPVTLNSSTGTDVRFVAGTGVTLASAGDSLVINATAVQPPAVENIENSTFTALAGIINQVDCSGGARTVNPPSTPTIGMRFSVVDATASAATNNITIDFDSANQNLYGSEQNYILNVNGAYVEFIYMGSTTGWIATKG